MNVSGTLLLFVAFNWSVLARVQLDTDGGYKGIDVAIHSYVPEDPVLIENIKQLFTNASQFLYNSSGNRFYFNEVSIKLPYSWTVRPEYSPVYGNAFESSNVRIDQPNPLHGNAPYTLQSGGCGEEGQYIHFTPDFIRDLDEATLDTYGPPERQLVHEWAHLKYGVYDEYGIPGDPRYPMFYYDNGRIRPSSCNKNVRGWIEDVDGGSCFIMEDGTISSDCIFIPDLAHANITASLMYMSFIPSVDTFCENEGERSHNSFAPTQQNTLCNYRSTWDVISSHPDYTKISKRNTPPTNIIPKFKIFQQTSKETSQIILLLDVSGSMEGEPLMLLRKAAIRFIEDRVPENSTLGVVTFSMHAYLRHKLVTVNETTRRSIISSLPTRVLSSTAIGKGLKLSLESFGNYAAGSLILLVTDGIENESPSIAEVIPSLVEAKVIVDTIAFGTQASDKLENLAMSTGGKVFFVSLTNVKTTFELDSAFLESITVQSDVSLQNAKLIDDEIQVTNSSIQEVYLESELGLNTIWTFVSPTIKSFNFEVIDPDDIPLRLEDESTHDETIVQNSDKVQFRFKKAKPGKWRVNISNAELSESNPKYISWSVTSEPIDVKVQPVKVRSWIGDLELQFPAHGKIYAEVKQGYNAVLHARVVASVDRPVGRSVDVELKDNGFGADINKNDGIYSAYFTHFNGDGRYSVVSRIVNNGDARIKSGSRGSGGLPIPKSKNKKNEESSYTFPIDDFISTETIEEYEEPTVPASLFQRASTTGSFKVSAYQENMEDPFPPSDILNLEVLKVDELSVTLRWTSPGNDLDEGQLNRTELRGSLYPKSLLKSFDTSYLITEEEVTSGSLTPPGPGEYHVVTVRIPEELTILNATIWSVYFAVKGFDDHDKSSLFHNVIGANFGNFVPERTTHWQPTTLIICLVTFFVLGSVLAGIIVVYHRTMKKKTTNLNRIL